MSEFEKYDLSHHLSDPGLGGSYVIGQAISALRNGRAIHPVLCAHAERYKTAN
ncbi:hypothetical protein HZF02_23870 [Pseudomonas yamanorum]|nr:hypothetical protein HZF02_23870 [Pseudomonas yamanorum]